MQTSTRKPMRVALLLQWRNRGYSRPSYGLVDDEELLRTGRAIFLGTDGQQLPTTRDDLLLLQLATDEVVATSSPAMSVT